MKTLFESCILKAIQEHCSDREDILGENYPDKIVSIKKSKTRKDGVGYNDRAYSHYEVITIDKSQNTNDMTTLTVWDFVMWEDMNCQVYFDGIDFIKEAA